MQITKFMSSMVENENTKMSNKILFQTWLNNGNYLFPTFGKHILPIMVL